MDVRMPCAVKTVIVGTGETAEAVTVRLRAWNRATVLVSDLARLEQAGIHKARRLVVVADGLTDVPDIVGCVVELCRRRRRAKQRLDLLLLTGDLVGNEASLVMPEVEPDSAVATRSLSIPQRAARLLLSRFPLHLGADVVFGQPLHILVAGFGALGRAIALQTVRLAHYGHGKPRLTILADEPERCRNDFFSAFPEAGQAAGLTFLNLDGRMESDCPISSAFVCLDDNVEVVRFAAKLQEELVRQQLSSPPVFLHMSTFDSSASVATWDGQTYPFSAVNDVCRPAVLFDHQGDELAAIIHDYYRDSIAAQGRSLDETPAGRPWNTLDESYRQASRHQADHVPAKLAAIDCRSVPEEVSEFFVFSPSEVECLAMIEHDRWSADRYLDGWSYGPERDNARKHHPELMPYDALSAEMKNLDRYAVRLVPVLLARQELAVKSNLLIGVSIDGAAPMPQRGFDNQIDAVLKRLCERFPDRFPVVAVDLSGAAERAAARRASECFGAALWVMLTEPVQRTLGRLDVKTCRHRYLDLLSVAECRIRLRDEQERQRWLNIRPDVLIVIGDRLTGNEDWSMAGVARNDAGGKKRRTAQRRVLVNSRSGETWWTFEY
jgi:RyR domain